MMTVDNDCTYSGAILSVLFCLEYSAVTSLLQKVYLVALVCCYYFHILFL